MRARLRHLIVDSNGATVLEFAFLVPILFGLMFGVLQIGLGMQAYNSLRAIAGDTARSAVTAYQISTAASAPPATTIASNGRSIATTPPYGLLSDDLTLNVTEVTPSRVDGAREFTISMTYFVPSILTIIGIEDIPISYQRPIFVIDKS